jgi:drug/metabolite transporter (DMT)-like permease
MLLAAFLTIYIVWGSTYLAIRVAVETLPAFLSAGVRFVVAGAALLLWLKTRGIVTPTIPQWRHAWITGSLMLIGGNGLVVWAERSLNSGFTAIVVALAPVWFALLDWARPRGTRPSPKTIIGIVLGFAGVTMLVGSRGATPGNEHLISAVAVVIAGISWAAGSLYSKHVPSVASPWMSAAAQMLCGGAGLLLVGFIIGEPARTEWSRISARSLLALGYLIVAGSWIAFSAYVWLLKNTAASRVATYAYVNPVIAVLLGWLLLGETLTKQMAWGAATILTGVVIILAPIRSLRPRRNAVRSSLKD